MSKRTQWIGIVLVLLGVVIGAQYVGANSFTATGSAPEEPFIPVGP